MKAISVMPTTPAPGEIEPICKYYTKLIRQFEEVKNTLQLQNFRKFAKPLPQGGVDSIFSIYGNTSAWQLIANNQWYASAKHIFINDVAIN